MAEAVSGLTGSLQGTITGLGNRGMQWLDTVFPPESRAKAMNAITKFCSEKPMLAVRFQLLLYALTLPYIHTHTIASSAPPVLSKHPATR